MKRTSMMQPFSQSLNLVQSIGRAFKSRNYRLFYAGQIVSLTGTWLSSVAMSWLLYRLAKQQDPDHAAFLLGLVGFCNQIPIFLVTPLAGVVIDRLDRHRMLVWTQALAMLQSFVLAGLTLTHLITIPQIIALSLFQGLINAFDMPTRQSFIVDLVETKADLSNAIALNASMVHAARFLGPALAGLLIYAIGEGWCFALDGVSYFAVIAALLAMRVPPFVAPKEIRPVWESMRSGFDYAFRSVPIRSLLLLVATSSLLATSQIVLLPIVADKVLSGNERTLGFLLGSSGLGAVLGSLYLATRRSIVGLGRVLVLASTALGAGMVFLGFSRVTLLSSAMLVATGGGLVLVVASANTMLQMIVDDDKRGRVMSLFTLSFMGIAPFGSLLAGSIAARIGAPWTITAFGLMALANAYRFYRRLPWLREFVRPLYKAKGILT